MNTINAEWMDVKELPSDYSEIEVKTPWGDRRAKRNYDGYYRFTDCTHPMQNCFLHPDNISAWRPYVNFKKLLK